LKKEFSLRHFLKNIDVFLGEYIQAEIANALSKDNYAILNAIPVLHPSDRLKIILQKKWQDMGYRQKRESQVSLLRATHNIWNSAFEAL
jgi:hypothetical protein